jgi:RND family efflux transporter MFP subunit
MLRATNEIVLATRMLEQRERLGLQGNIAERRVLESRAALRERKAELAISQRKLRALGLSDETLREVLETRSPVRTIPIVSPRCGFVASADVRAGQFVQPTDPLYHIVDLSEVWVHAGVLETDSHGIAEGQPIRMSFAALPDETFGGDVHHVDLRVDTERHTLPVTGLLSDSEGRVKPGMFGRMTIVVNSRPEAVACPQAAILSSPEGPYVLVADLPSIFLRRRVELGLRQGGVVEVLAGLFPGDEVVTTGNIFLASLFQRAATGDEHHKAPPAIASISATAPPKVTNATKHKIAALGRVELPTFRKLFASSTIAGRVNKIYVEHGQHVKKGEVLADVQSLQLRTLELDLLLAQTRLALAGQSLARYQQLDLNGAIAEKDMWQLQTDYNTLRNTVASLEHQLTLVGLSASEVTAIEGVDPASDSQVDRITGIMPVRAPADGWIVDFELVPGEIVQPNLSLFEIHDLTRVEVQGFVFENDAVHVRPGQKVTVTLASDPQFKAQSTVLRIAPTLNTLERVMTVWTELDNPGHKLKDGMLARLEIETDQ